MMNFVSTWLFPAQLLVITTAQDVGSFVHVTGVHKMTFDVNEEAHFKEAGVADDPYAGIQSGDLTTLTYTSGDTFTTDFRNETIEFMRVAESFTPGVFEYAEPVTPHFKLTYLIRDDGLIGIQASCNRRRTSQLPFRLSRRDKGVQYLHYELESAGTGTLDQLFIWSISSAHTDICFMTIYHMWSLPRLIGSMCHLEGLDWLSPEPSNLRVAIPRQ
ncbi:hypothetical protein FOZ62_019523 [Perkinsus olseni]|uniref:GTP-binding protein 10 n=2 Tax=Perkinsus olseni TaxID=32597 RepID=A0A7J6SUD6_PEROL|nr:hypothetical protein FOZ62_019523 [Perkinsus olseni]